MSENVNSLRGVKSTPPNAASGSSELTSDERATTQSPFSFTGSAFPNTVHGPAAWAVPANARAMAAASTAPARLAIVFMPHSFFFLMRKHDEQARRDTPGGS